MKDFINNQIETETETDSVEQELTPEMLDARVIQALRKKIFFCAEMADFLELDRRDVYVSLCRLIEKGKVASEVIRNEREEEVVMYRLFGEKPASAATAKKAENGAAKPKIDKDGFESGTYQEPPGRAKVIKALEANHYQTSKMLCQNTMLSIGEVLDIVEIETDDDITTEMVGSIHVYYLRKNAPEGRLYNGGDGKFYVNQGEKRTRPAISNSMIEQDTKNAAYRSNGENRFHIKPESWEDKNGGVKTKESSSDYGGAPPTIDISAKALEDLAAEGMSQKEAASRLNIGYSTLTLKLRENASLRKAWDDGKERLRKSGQNKIVPADKIAEIPEFPEEAREPATAEPNDEKVSIEETAKEYVKAEPLELTAEKVEQYAFEGLTVKMVADKFKIPYGTFNGWIYLTDKRNGRPELRDAWKRGKDRRALAGSEAPKRASRVAKTPKSAVRKKSKTASQKTPGRPLTQFEQVIYDSPPFEENSSEKNGETFLDHREETQTAPETKFVKGKMIAAEQTTSCYGCLTVFPGFPYFVDDKNFCSRDCYENRQSQIEACKKLANSHISVTPQEDEAFREIEKASPASVFAVLGCANCGETFTNFPYLLGELELCSFECQEAVRVKQNSEVQTDSRFAHQLEHISENGHSRESIERVKSQLTETKPMPEVLILGAPQFPGHTKTIQLSNDKKIVIGTDANIFETTGEEFELLGKLRGLVQDYEAKGGEN